MLIESPSSATRQRRRRLRVLIASAVAALFLHVAVLTETDLQVGTVAAAVALPTAMQVRSVDAPKPVAAGALRPALAVAPIAATVAVAERVPPKSAPEQGPQPTAATGPNREGTLAAASDRNPGAPAPAAAADMPVPVYRTRMPPPATLHFALRKGLLSGTGELSWAPAGDRYEARLEGRVGGLLVITQTSAGRLDTHGIAPVRYTDARARRAPSAANFQRDTARITYSGPATEYPLVPGAQDRLSWMLQIAAVLNAEPQRATAGAEVVFFVSGASGDADIWAFRCDGAETLTTSAGAIHAVKFTRQPRHAYDRLVEVWLAPAQDHLPVRARFTSSEGVEPFELLLRDITAP